MNQEVGGLETDAMYQSLEVSFDGTPPHERKVFLAFMIISILRTVIKRMTSELVVQINFRRNASNNCSSYVRVQRWQNLDGMHQLHCMALSCVAMESGLNGAENES